jgi:hypothetical protein
MTAEAEIERLKTDAALWESRTKQGAEIIMGNVAEIARLRAALGELLSGHDNLYIAHFGPDSNPHDDIAAKPARRALEPKP